MNSIPFQFPRVLAWEVTRQCPLKCRHCRAGALLEAAPNELSTDACKQILHSLVQDGQPPLIIWTGGEPMMRADILDLVRTATQLHIPSVMAPCGFFVTPQTTVQLKEAGVRAFSLSLDGKDAPSHDSFRGVQGAYEQILKAMDVARHMGLPFQVNTTVSTFNVHDLESIYEIAVQQGATRLDLFFLVTVGRGKALAPYALSAEQTSHVLDWAFKKTLQGPIPIKETCCPSAPARWTTYLAQHPSTRTDLPRLKPCGCLGARGFAFLSHAGDLQMCGFIEKPCGNIRSTGYDFSQLIRQASRPLGAEGTCRTSFVERNS